MPKSLHSSNPFLYLLGLIFTVLTSLRRACGDESQPDAWINPQAEGGEVLSPPSYMMGSNLTLEWTTDFSTEYVLLYANDGNPNHYEVILDNQSTSTFGTSYNWTVATYLQLIDGFNFVLYNDTLGATFLNHFATVPFNISQNATTSQSSSLLTSTISSSGSTAIPSPTAVAFTTVILTSAPSPSSASTAGAISTTSIPHKTVIGLGVGLGLAVPLCLLVGVCVGLRLRRRAQPKLTENASGYHGQPISKPLQDKSLQELYASDVPELHQEHSKELCRRPVAELSPTHGCTTL